MRSTFKILFYLKRDKVKKNGNVPLYCRITIDGKEARFGIKKDVQPKLWDVNNGRAIGRTSEATEINELLESIKSAIHKVYQEMLDKDNNVTAEKVKNGYLGFDTKHHTLLEFFDEHNKERKMLVGINVKKETVKKYRITRQHLADYLKKWRNLSDISLKEINLNFVSDFELYLLTERKCAINSVASYMRLFKYVMGLAVKKKLIFDNPFSDFKIQLKKTDRGFLTRKEVEIILNQEFSEKCLEKVRDVFVFCCFSGISHIDAMNLTHNEIQTSFDGKLWIINKRHKTDIGYKVPLLEIPKRILDKYKGTLPNNLVLPVKSTQYTNRCLRQIGKICNINKYLTFHMSRHTFATMTLSNGVSIESVSKMLGHTNIATTQIYARITDNKIGNEMIVFAGNVVNMDAEVQTEKVKIDDVLQSLKISTGKTSGKVWETLTEKVWGKMTNIDCQIFASKIEVVENKPKTIRDFYVVLMDSFLENLNGHSEKMNFQSEYFNGQHISDTLSGIEPEIDKLAVNF